jgi:hypothetical protein
MHDRRSLVCPFACDNQMPEEYVRKEPSGDARPAGNEKTDESTTTPTSILDDERVQPSKVATEPEVSNEWGWGCGVGGRLTHNHLLCRCRASH